MPNFLEQLVAEWYEYRGYFVRRNVKVERLAKGGFGAELDVVAFHPERRHLVHIEPSMDADSKAKREIRFAKKFTAGRKHIPALFRGLELPEPEQIALLVLAGAQKTIGGGKVLRIEDFMNEVRFDRDYGVAFRQVIKRAVPEQYVILRSLQFAANYWKKPEQPLDHP